MVDPQDVVAQRRLRKGALFTPFSFFFLAYWCKYGTMVHVYEQNPLLLRPSTIVGLSSSADVGRVADTTFLSSTVNRFYCIGIPQGILGHITRWEGFPLLAESHGKCLARRARKMNSM